VNRGRRVILSRDLAVGDYLGDTVANNSTLSSCRAVVPAARLSRPRQRCGMVRRAQPDGPYVRCGSSSAG